MRRSCRWNGALPTACIFTWTRCTRSRAHHRADQHESDRPQRQHDSARHAAGSEQRGDQRHLRQRAVLLEARPYHENVKFWSVNPGAELLFGAEQDIKLNVQANATRSWLARESPSILVTSPFTTVDYRNEGGDRPSITSPLDLNDPNLGWGWTGGRVNIQNESARPKRAARAPICSSVRTSATSRSARPTTWPSAPSVASTTAPPGNRWCVAAMAATCATAAPARQSRTRPWPAI